MAWVRIHDGAMSHPKVIGLSDKAFRLWVWGLTHSQQHLTDGMIAVVAIPPRLRRAANDLARFHLWDLHEDGGYEVHDYLEWNDSRAIVLKKRGAARDRMTSLRGGSVRANSMSEQTRSCHAERSVVNVPCRVGVRRNLPEKGSGEKPDEEALAERAGRLREELYPAWYAKHRRGARLRLTANTLEFQEALTLVQTWDDGRLEKLAQIVLTTGDEWIAQTDRGFMIFAKKASWADDRLRQAETGAI